MGYFRRSARVFLVDKADRVLLMRCAPEDIWVTPGGGVEAGEALAQTAARELREEIGLRVEPSDLLGPVAFIEGFLRGDLYRDDFFHFRVDEHEVDDEGQDDFERSQILEYRWWSLDEIRETTEFVVPLGMADLLEEIAAGRVGARPVALRFHH